MRRRRLLGVVATGSVGTVCGCIDVGSGSCSGPTITEASAEYDVYCGRGTVIRVAVTVEAPDCEHEVTLDVCDETRRKAYGPRTIWPDYEHREELTYFPGSADPITVRVLSSSDDVVDRRTIPVSPMPSNGPPTLRILSASVDPKAVTTGETTTVDVTFENEGREGRFDAEVASDGETLTTATEWMDGADQCGGPIETRTSLSTSFPRPGEHPLRVLVQPEDENGSGDEADLGTVTVERSGDG